MEKDDAADLRPLTQAVIGFNGVDTTLNVVPAMQGKVRRQSSVSFVEHIFKIKLVVSLRSSAILPLPPLKGERRRGKKMEKELSFFKF